MQTFIKSNGQVFTTPTFMMGPALKVGYEWHSRDDGVWVERPQQPTIDINDRRLFGYTESEFLAKQYR